MTPDLKIQDLPDSEEKVMLALWRCGGEASFYQIQLALEGERWAPSTLLNFLYRLEKRGFVRVSKQGGRNRYLPLIDRRRYLAGRVRRFLERFWGGSLTRMTGEMLTARALGDEELESLHHLLEKDLAERYTGEDDLYDPWEG